MCSIAPSARRVGEPGLVTSCSWCDKTRHDARKGSPRAPFRSFVPTPSKAVRSGLACRRANARGVVLKWLKVRMASGSVSAGGPFADPRHLPHAGCASRVGGR
jgi:hypothetical protein